MIHEGPLLEYAGRDLAFLQWAAAARHWVVLVLGAELFLPHRGGFAASLGLLAAGVAVAVRRARARRDRRRRRCGSCACRRCSASAARSRSPASASWIGGVGA